MYVESGLGFIITLTMSNQAFSQCLGLSGYSISLIKWLHYQVSEKLSRKCVLLKCIFPIYTKGLGCLFSLA